MTRLLPFSADDALVVGQVEGRGLHAVVRVAGGINLVDDDDAAPSPPSFGLRNFGSIGR